MRRPHEPFPYTFHLPLLPLTIYFPATFLFQFIPPPPITMSAMNIDRALDDIVKESRAMRRSTKKSDAGASGATAAPPAAAMEGTGARKSRRRKRKSGGERGTAAMDAESARMNDSLSRKSPNKGRGGVISKRSTRSRGGGLSSAAAAAVARAGAMEIERKAAAAAAASGSKANAGYKIVVHNLHHGVTNGDINDLFSGVGKLQRALVIYDGRGHSTGVAEVVFVRRDDALESIKRYNGVPLDNKPLRISLASADSPTSRTAGAPLPTLNTRAKGKKLAVAVDKSRVASAAAAAAASSGHGSGSGRSAKSSRGRRGGGGGGGGGSAASTPARQPREKKVPLTSADLDAQLDNYRMTD